MTKVSDKRLQDITLIRYKADIDIEEVKSIAKELLEARAKIEQYDKIFVNDLTNFGLNNVWNNSRRIGFDCYFL